MLDLNSSRIDPNGTQMRPLASTVTSIEEGVALALVLEAGSAKVAPCTGSATEQFAGLALNKVRDFTTFPVIENVTVPASPYKVTLAYTPIADSVHVQFVGGAFLTVGSGAPAGTGEVQLVGKELTFHSADAAKAVRITYKRNLSVVEAQALYGDGYGDGAQSVINGTGVIVNAEVVFTDKWDPAVDWTVKTGPVYTGENGVLTLDTAGALCRNVHVVQAPTAAFPLLGVRISI